MAWDDISIHQEKQDTFQIPATGPGRKWQWLAFRADEGYRAASLPPWGGHRGFWSWVSFKVVLGVPASLSTLPLTQIPHEVIIQEVTQMCSLAPRIVSLFTAVRKHKHTCTYQSARPSSSVSLPQISEIQTSPLDGAAGMLHPTMCWYR